MYSCRSFMHWVALWLVTVCCTCGSLAQAAAEMIGQMVWVKGGVTATVAGGAPRVLQRQSHVFKGDTITTDANGGGQIVFTDGSLLSLRSGTLIALSQYSYTKEQSPEKNNQVIDLVKGGFRTVTGFIAHTHVDGYSVKTPVATIGVRGTDYTVVYEAGAGLSVKLDKGAIKVFNEGGQADLNVKTAQVFAQIRTISETPQPSKTVPTSFAPQPAPVPARAPPPPPKAAMAPAAAPVAASGPTKSKPSGDNKPAASSSSSDSGSPGGGVGSSSSSGGSEPPASGGGSSQPLQIGPSAPSGPTAPTAPKSSGFCIS